MLSFPRPAKSPTITAPHRFLHRFRLKPFSTTAVPSQEHIARLILDQKSPNEALQTFKWASKIPNFLHSQSTFRALIHKLCLFRRFKTANQVLRQIPISIGCPPDEETFITIIRDFGRFRMVQQAIQVLDLIPQFDLKPSLKILNSALDVLVKVDIDLAKEFYRNRMMGSGIEPDSYTFGILMKGLCLTNRIAEGFKLLSLMKSRNLAPNSVIYNTLIHALCKNGKVGRGRSLMNEMDLPNDVTFNILISGYCSEGNLVQSMVLFDQCLSLGFVPDVVTVTKLIKVCCREGRVSDAVEVLQRVEERGIMVDSVAYNAVIKGYCDSGKVRVGTNLLKKMAAKGILPNLSTFNTLITGFCDNGELDLALDLFYEMKIDGVLPDFFTYDTLIRGLCVGGRIEDGLKILNLLEANRKGPEGQIGAYNSVIYGFYRDNRMGEAHKFLRQIGCFFPRAVDRSLTILHLCEEGEIGEAMGVYDRMVGEGGTPSTIIYASLIDGFCREGDLCRAFGLMNEMVAHKYLPSVSTFNSLISGFCREGKVGSAVKLMDEMIERGCLPDTGSYNPLIAACCRNGDFVKAFELLMLMVEKHVCPDPVTWNCLLLYLSKKMIGIENKNMIYVNGILNQILHIDRLTELDG